MRLRPRAIVALVVALLAPAPAVAGTISISMTPVPELRDGTLRVRLTVKNLGDEAAQSVVPTLRFRDAETRGKGTPSLAPQKSLEEILSVPATGVAQGRWPYSLTVDYTDANQYPFQALHVLLATVGTPPPAKVLVSRLESAPLATSATLRLTLKNVSDGARTASVRVLVPEGIQATAPASDVALAGYEERTVDVPLVNRSALAGSRLPVFAEVEYDDGGTHQAVVAQGIVEIVAVQSFFVRHKTALGVLALALILGWAALVAVRLVRR
ncbi:MAG TPA: hypothetical protein VFD84_20165 [Candidatus Binatia bacterium]|jgi:hypothetical protein|nr:hypothetical protein [Candidatus Binatia bacterium]